MKPNFGLDALVLATVGAVVLLGAVTTQSPRATPELVGVAVPIDGDTLELHGIRVRLYGIDAPESCQLCLGQDGRQYRCGQAAANALAQLIGRGPVACSQRDVDRYGRIVATCEQGDIDLGEWLVSAGFALAYRKYSTDYDAEAVAQDERRGIWSGTFEAPWAWRKTHPACGWRNPE